MFLTIQHKQDKGAIQEGSLGQEDPLHVGLSHRAGSQKLGSNSTAIKTHTGDKELIKSFSELRKDRHPHIKEAYKFLGDINKKPGNKTKDCK